MEYDEWCKQLFEDTYPRYSIVGGEINWHDKAHLSIHWGGKEYDVDARDFYNEHSRNPVDEISDWAYRNLPIITSEMSDAYVHWNPSKNSFVASVLRNNGRVVYSTPVANAKEFVHYGSLDATVFTSVLNGNILCIESNKTGISPLCALSHPITFKESIDGFFLPEDNIHLTIPLDDAQRVFIGHRNPLGRIREDNVNMESISLAQWHRIISEMEEK